jgi:hypothetical protein
MYSPQGTPRPFYGISGNFCGVLQGTPKNYFLMPLLKNKFTTKLKNLQYRVLQRNFY